MAYPIGRRHTARLLRLIVCVALTACAKSAAATGDSASAKASATATTATPDASPTSTVSLPVVADVARDGDLVLRVNTTGLVRSDAVIHLSAEVGGVVKELLVRPGSVVTKGQPIVRLDPYPFELAVREAQAKSDEAEQRLLESFGPESLVTGKGPTPEQRRALTTKAGLAGAKLALERAKYDQTKSVITSPVDGVMDAVQIAAGERINSGQQLATVVDTRNLRIEAQVLEHDLALLHTGGDAFITSAGAPGHELRGRIDAILPLVDSVTRAGRAIVRVENNSQLRPGMYADVQLESVRLPHRRLVPARAVIERDGRPLVFVVRDGRAQWTYILPGRSNGIDTEVLPDSASGQIPVKAGDQVIIDGHLTLTHDAPVKISAVHDSRRPQP